MVVVLVYFSALRCCLRYEELNVTHVGVLYFLYTSSLKGVLANDSVTIEEHEQNRVVCEGLTCVFCSFVSLVSAQCSVWYHQWFFLHHLYISSRRDLPFLLYVL